MLSHKAYYSPLTSLTPFLVFSTFSLPDMLPINRKESQPCAKHFKTSSYAASGATSWGKYYCPSTLRKLRQAATWPAHTAALTSELISVHLLERLRQEDSKFKALLRSNPTNISMVAQASELLARASVTGEVYLRKSLSFRGIQWLLMWSCQN